MFQKIDASGKLNAVHFDDLSFFLIEDIDRSFVFFSVYNTRSPGKIFAEGYHVGIFIRAERLAEPHDEQAFQQIRLSLGVLTQ